MGVVDTASSEGTASVVCAIVMLPTDMDTSSIACANAAVMRAVVVTAVAATALVAGRTDWTARMIVTHFVLKPPQLRLKLRHLFVHACTHLLGLLPQLCIKVSRARVLGLQRLDSLFQHPRAVIQTRLGLLDLWLNAVQCWTRWCTRGCGFRGLTYSNVRSDHCTRGSS
jgi:hypothetical protein